MKNNKCVYNIALRINNVGINFNIRFRETKIEFIIVV